MSKPPLKAVYTMRDCVVCGRSFRARNKTHLLCSPRCRSKREHREKTVTIVSHDMSMLGEAAELLVAADLMRRGVQVFQNIARTGPADLVAWVPGRHGVAFIDVKGITTAYRKADGTLSIPYESDLRDSDRQTWIVRVVGTEVHYPPALLDLLEAPANA